MRNPLRNASFAVAAEALSAVTARPAVTARSAVTACSAITALAAITTLALLPAPLQAQIPEERPRWFADVRYDRDAFAGEDSPIWTDWWAVRGSVYRGFESGSLGIEGSLDRRFGQTDESFAVDASRDLWDRAYGNLRVRVTPGADVLPFSDWRADLFQALAGPWEASAHVRYLDSTGADVTLGGAGVARYAPPWYVEVRGSYLSGGGPSGGAVSGGTVSGGTEDAGRAQLTVRRYMGGIQQYVEIAGGAGGDVITVSLGPDVQVRDSWYARISVQRYFWVLGRPVTDPDIGSERLVGIQLTGGLRDYEDIPVRRRLSIGLIASF